MLKARAASEGGKRIIYLEASNEDVDLQGEKILAKALQDSAPYYLRHGNVDLKHYTVSGAVPNHLEYEIGRPVAVEVGRGKTFVKAELYQGNSAMARHADMVWESLTQQQPPARWYASVGGAVLSKSVQSDPDTGERVAVVSRVRWFNTALDRCPVNSTVPTVSAQPIGLFAKSLGGFVICKGLEAGYGTDSAALTGGAALREQSLDPEIQNYWDFRDRIATALKRRKIERPTSDAIVAHASRHFGMSQSDAADMTARFMADLRDGISKGKK